MQDWQERVIDESRELTERLHKLRVFMGGSVYARLPYAEKMRLRQQSLVMETYMLILDDRIVNFDGPVTYTGAAPAQPKSPATPTAFRTSDGYTLRLVEGMWTDGDLSFASGEEGWPIESNGSKLSGNYLPEPEVT